MCATQLYILPIFLLILPAAKMVAPETRIKRETTCKPPIANTGSLEENSEEKFPEADFEKAKLSKELKEYIDNKNEAFDSIQKFESRISSQYPDCMYNAMCKPTRKMAYKTKIISDEDCWIVEKLSVAECDSELKHDFSCSKFDIPEDVRVGCHPNYKKQNVLSFCKGEFKFKEITVASSCKAISYQCNQQ